VKIAWRCRLRKTDIVRSSEVGSVAPFAAVNISRNPVRLLSSGALCGLFWLTAREDFAREELAMLMLIEPRALEIERRNAGELRERECVDRRLRERLVGDRAGLIVEDVDRAIAHLHEIDVAGDSALPTGYLGDGARALSPTASR
jgi:hypothetical protein